MLTSSDVLNTARAILHRLFYRNVLGTVGDIFSIEVFERDIAPCWWLATIEVSECRVSRPITFSLSLASHSQSPLKREASASVFEMSFEMSSSFPYGDKQYGYWRGRWYQNGAPMSAELPERLHPLASVSAATVDATVLRIESFRTLGKLLSMAGVHPADAIGARPFSA